MSPPTAPPAPVKSAGRARGKLRTALLAHGEPMVWLTGGALTIALLMIVGLLLLILVEGTATFWPGEVVQVRTADGKVYLGEVSDTEAYEPDVGALASLPPEAAEKARAAVARDGGRAVRRKLRTGNFDLTKTHFQTVSDFEVAEETRPEWALVVERLEWGRFYGFPRAFVVDGQEVAAEPDEVWAKYNEYHGGVLERGRRRFRLEKFDKGAVGEKKDLARKAVQQAEVDYGRASPEYAAAVRKAEEVEAWAAEEDARLDKEIKQLKDENARYRLRLATADGRPQDVALADVVRAYPANRLGFWDKVGVYKSRWGEFLSDDPREANSEGGVFPAIVGTVVMTLFMTLAVVPFGVLAALYLREYARAGPVVSAVRIAINNLAGVPSIVFGMFGLVFFCYIVGGGVDWLFFRADLPNPTYGKGALVWAALTLALLTLPVVIVATEEALAAVPGSMREGSYACGASKWQTIRRIVLPRALPGVLTGTILAMARGAGEVAPIMLVGAVKLAPELPVDGAFPYVHPQRSFMHLGFHVFDLGFQSPNAEAAKPMVFTTTLLLISLIAVLNLAAVWLRGRLRRRYLTSKF